MRARLPDQTGMIVRDGVHVRWEVHGRGTPTLLMMPTWSIVHSRAWKAQIPYLARHFRVVVFDGRGNGASDRPQGPERYATAEFVADAIAVLDATATDRAIPLGFSLGGHHAAVLAARHPKRVLGAVLMAPAAPFGPSVPGRSREAFVERRNDTEGWSKQNLHYWQHDYRGFLEFFFHEAFPEPHSTKQIEDCVGWALDTSVETLTDATLGRYLPDDCDEALYRSIGCPVLVVHGDDDRLVPHAKGRLVAELTGAEMVTLEGAGHLPLARDPVAVNRLIHGFVTRVVPPAVTLTRTQARGMVRRRRRVLYLSSPIGLGHARRDLAIARALRARRDDLDIAWLTQHPVTRLLETAGETVHPASRLLANESQHIESEAGEHDLHVFEALRRMDEILVANFMLFQEAVEEGAYDLVIADESWEVDHFWHEHPELKRGALAWMTDFVGHLPMPAGGAHEATLTADCNAEMIGHVARFPRVRDRAIFVGNSADIVAGRFGPHLPEIRAWTETHFQFCGYITGRDPAEIADRAALRHQFGFGVGETVCVVTVGGSAVGLPLLRRVIAAAPTIRRHLPGLRMIVVAGPRIDPAALPQVAGVEVHGSLADLDLRLAAADCAMVQGGLSTCMELAAARVPFLYFPLRNHFEQQLHVRHRLQRYGAGRALDAAMAEPDAIAEALLGELRRASGWLPVEQDGAARAAEMLSALL